MTDETYFNITIKVEGEKVGIKKEHNLPATLPHLPPAAGVYIATLILALENVIQNDDKLIDVIHLVCTPDEAQKVNDALQAVRMLMEIDETIDKMQIEGENGDGESKVDTPPDQN